MNTSRLIKLMVTLMLSAFILNSISSRAVANSENVKDFQLIRDIVEYRISKYDVIDINIIGLKDIPGLNTVRVGVDGYISLPFVGFLKVSGMTIPEVKEILESRLCEYFVIPDLSIIVREYGARYVYVAGEVHKAGMYALPIDKMNLFAAITSAGGITNRGRPKHIAVVRVVDQQVIVKELNFDSFVEKQDNRQNVLLEDGDMVFVPRSNKIVLSEDIFPVMGTLGFLRNATQ